MNKQIQMHKPDATEPGLLEATAKLLSDIADRKEHILNALAYTHDTHTFDDIVRMILTGRLVFWPLPNSFMILELITYPQTKHLHGFLCGGNLNELLVMQHALEFMAKSNGATKITLAGRKGWEKPLLSLGWKPMHSVFAFDVKADEGE